MDKVLVTVQNIFEMWMSKRVDPQNWDFFHLNSKMKWLHKMFVLGPILKYDCYMIADIT